MIERMARRVTSPTLVGRAEVVAQLGAAVKAGGEGQPRHAIIGGEAGVGKTRLLAESRINAEVAGARVLTGGCVSMGVEGLPYSPFTEIIRTLVAEEGASAVIAAAGRAAPDLARLVPALDTGEAAPDQEMWAQTRLYEALLDLFRRLAERQPLVLQLEDLHWADAGTLAATSHLLRAVHDEPITIVATFRVDEVTRKHPVRQWLAEAVRLANVERIELEPLVREDVVALIGHILGAELPESEVTEIQERADGNPFFVEELLCCRAEYDATMPASLRDVLLSRVDAIAEGPQRLLGVAAVGGREVEHEMLLAVADREETADEVRVLVDAGLLVPTRALDGDDAYGFRHALVQEAVYDAMLPTERRRLHQRWGEYLSHHSAAAAAALVQLAHHWREARDPRALVASIAAGDGAMASYSYGVAAREYGEALLLWQDEDHPGLDVDHVELLGRHARSSYLASEFRTAAASSREAIDELGGSDPARRTLLLIQLARIQWVSGEWGSATDTYELALETSPSEPPIVRVRALAGLGQAYMLHARHHEARPMLEAAIEGARSIGARDVEGHALNTLAAVLVGLGEVDPGLAAIDAARDIALELRIPDDVGRAYVNKVDMESWSGHPARALETSFEGMRVADEWGVGASYGAYIGYTGVGSAFELGRWAEALDLITRADRIHGAIGGSFLYRATYIVELLAGLGDERFDQLWERAARLVLEAPPSDHAGLLFQGGIQRAAFAGDLEGAAAYTRQALAMLAAVDSGIRLVELVRVGAWPLAELGATARQAGDEEMLARSREELQAALTLAEERRSALRPSGRLEELAALDLAEVDTLRSRLEGTDTTVQWQALADRWAAIDRPFRTALARWHQAETAERADDRDGAVLALRAAYDIASDLGARPLLGHLDAMARRLRVRLGGTQTTSAKPQRAYGLTKRESEVLIEVAAGRTNREIAERLFISESTAGVHVSNILGKLSVSTRTEAARVALDQGLVANG